MSNDKKQPQGQPKIVAINDSYKGVAKLQPQSQSKPTTNNNQGKKNG